MTTIKGSTNSDTTGTKSCTCICDKQLYQCPNNNSCPIVAYPEPTESKPDGWFHCVECENPKEDCTCVELPLKADARPVKEVTAPLSDKVEEAVNELANEDAQWREENPVTHSVKEVEKEETEIYYCLSDNGDLDGLYLSSMREVSEHIEMDLGDIEPSDREKVQYTITPVYMTQTEFNNLPEYEG